MNTVIISNGYVQSVHINDQSQILIFGGENSRSGSGSATRRAGVLTVYRFIARRWKYIFLPRAEGG
jgi:hypothetical protein